MACLSNVLRSSSSSLSSLSSICMQLGSMRDHPCLSTAVDQCKNVNNDINTSILRSNQVLLGRKRTNEKFNNNDCNNQNNINDSNKNSDLNGLFLKNKNSFSFRGLKNKYYTGEETYDKSGVTKVDQKEISQNIENFNSTSKKYIGSTEEKHNDCKSCDLRANSNNDISNYDNSVANSVENMLQEKLDQEIKKFEKAVELLTAKETETVVARDKQIKLIYNYTKKHIESKCGGAIYISGASGTGKTCVVTSTIAKLCKDNLYRNNVEKKYVFINCSNFDKDLLIFNELANRLEENYRSSVSHDKKSNSLCLNRERDLKNMCERERIEELSKKFVDKFKKKDKITICILDEVDFLESNGFARSDVKNGLGRKRREVTDVLLALFKTATNKDSNIFIIAISNSPNLISHMKGVNVQQILFEPYTEAQLKSIINERLKSLHEKAEFIFDEIALNLLVRKIVNLSGDCRICLDGFCRAINSHIGKLRHEKEALKSCMLLHNSSECNSRKTLNEEKHNNTKTVDFCAMSSNRVLRSSKRRRSINRNEVCNEMKCCTKRYNILNNENMKTENREDKSENDAAKDNLTKRLGGECIIAEEASEKIGELKKSKSVKIETEEKSASAADRFYSAKKIVLCGKNNEVVAVDDGGNVSTASENLCSNRDFNHENNSIINESENNKTSLGSFSHSLLPNSSNSSVAQFSNNCTTLTSPPSNTLQTTIADSTKKNSVSNLLTPSHALAVDSGRRDVSNDEGANKEADSTDSETEDKQSNNEASNTSTNYYNIQNSNSSSPAIRSSHCIISVENNAASDGKPLEISPLCKMLNYKCDMCIHRKTPTNDITTRDTLISTITSSISTAALLPSPSSEASTFGDEEDQEEFEDNSDDTFNIYDKINLLHTICTRENSIINANLTPCNDEGKQEKEQNTETFKKGGNDNHSKNKNSGNSCCDDQSFCNVNKTTTLSFSNVKTRITARNNTNNVNALQSSKNLVKTVNNYKNKDNKNETNYYHNDENINHHNHENIKNNLNKNNDSVNQGISEASSDVAVVCGRSSVVNNQSGRTFGSVLTSHDSNKLNESIISYKRAKSLGVMVGRQNSCEGSPSRDSVLYRRNTSSSINHKNQDYNMKYISSYLSSSSLLSMNNSASAQLMHYSNKNKINYNTNQYNKSNCTNIINLYTSKIGVKALNATADTIICNDSAFLMKRIGGLPLMHKIYLYCACQAALKTSSQVSHTSYSNNYYETENINPVVSKSIIVTVNALEKEYRLLRELLGVEALPSSLSVSCFQNCLDNLMELGLCKRVETKKSNRKATYIHGCFGGGGRKLHSGGGVMQSNVYTHTYSHCNNHVEKLELIIAPSLLQASIQHIEPILQSADINDHFQNGLEC